MKPIMLNHDTLISRRDLLAIVSMIPERARILDLGCGSGRLLRYLMLHKKAKVTGVECDQEQVVRCVNRGVPVIQANLDDGLSEFADNSYDFVILTQTLQAVKRPDLLLEEMLRVGKTGIVSFLNFGYFRARAQLMLGTMPVTKILPRTWYNTPNIHFGTICDFRNLCRERSIRIVREIPLLHSLTGLSFFSNLWPNLFASTCIFIIER